MAVSLAPSLTTLFNTCIQCGQWPSSWKRGVWTPVFKKEDKADYTNYRPVTVLNAVAKVFESFLSRQIIEKIDTHLYDKLSAYRKTHSCETNLIRVTEDWRKAMDNKECVAVLSTDMSKAFDSLHHALMIKKLEAYGFSDMSLQLMRSYFTERQNCVKINGVTSTWREQLRGRPQGSSLGPLLWNIFQNDLPLNVHTSNLFMYADDHQVYQSGSDITTIISELKNEAENVSRWYRANLLHANPKKYQVLVMTPRNVDKEAKDECTLAIDNQKLKPTANLRILGVNIDDKLSFTEHISDICKKVSKKIGVLARLRNLISSKTKLQLYLSAILPHLTYCQTVWHFCKQSERRKLERLQERTLRVIYNCRTDTYEDLLRRAKLPSLYNRRLQEIVTLMYKVRNGLAPDYICELFSFKNKVYSLRNADFDVPRYSTVRYGKHSIRYLGPYLWSRLSPSDRQQPSLDNFRRNIRKKDLASLVEGTCSNCALCTY